MKTTVYNIYMTLRYLVTLHEHDVQPADMGCNFYANRRPTFITIYSQSKAEDIEKSKR